ncbi:MAG: signal recognition particle protein [Planctomycetes bacterium]|nr:signal recognition particle protein [Planctomycetota bacterium]
MFESLREGLTTAFKTLRGKARLSESNMRDGLKLVEDSLLEADVSYDVVRDFMERVTAKALGERVLNALDPSQQVVAIVHEELIGLLGEADPSLHLNKDVNIVMMCGLQGSGKTTTCGKLARLLLENDVRPMLVAADLQRPAAIEQLHVIGRQLGVSVYSESGATDPVAVCRNAVAKARAESCRVVVLDTAGRLAIDRELMDQLAHIDRQVEPDQCYLVVDGMTGQDAVNSAKAFNEALELNGVIMTKLDGDARGGALLSVRHVTGVPIKFIGTGEHLDALEPFRPEGMAGRILGLGDIVALANEAQRLVDEKERIEYERKLQEGDFTLEDFRDQLEKIARPGLIQRIVGFLPGMDAMRGMLDSEDAAGGMRRLAGIVNAMTRAERTRPRIIDAGRRNRIARGAGVEPREVSELIQQFEGMKTVVEGMAGKDMRSRMQAFKELQESGLMNPGAVIQKVKKGTGKRLTSHEKAKLRQQREKELRRRRREERRR